MSFSRSGSTAPAFSFPIGYGSFTDVNASNAVFTSNVYSSFYRGDGGFLSNVNSSIPGTLPNLVVSNSLTVTNVFATIYRGDGGLLSNISGSSGPVAGNTLSNLNASNLSFGVVSSTLIYGNTLSNINSSNITQPFANLVVSNTVTTSNAIVGLVPAAIQANLHVEQSDVFIGNSAAVGSITNTTGTPNKLILDNTGPSGTPSSLNKIVLMSNTTASGAYAGFSVGQVNPTSATLYYGARSSHVFNLGPAPGTEVARFSSGGYFLLGTTVNSAKLYVGTSLPPTTNIQVRIDSSNVALVTSGTGLVGFGTLTPTANLHVVGNVYASNALTTTNLFANTLTLANASSTINVIGSVTASTFYGALAGSNTGAFSNLYSANALTTTNIFAAGFTSNVSNTIFNYSTLTVPFVTATTLNVSSTSNLSYTYVTGNVGIQSSTASYPLDVGASASIPASGGETIRSYGPLIIGNGSNDNRRFISALDSSMTAGNSRFIAFGQAASTNNQGELKFVYAGAGSASNRVGLGVFGSEPISVIAGGVGIFTTAPTASLHVTGNVFASNALVAPSVYGTSIVGGSYYGTIAGSNTMSGSTQTLGGTAGVTTLNVTGNVFVSNTVSTPNVLVTSNIGFSSATGTGGTATQLTSRNTGVTLNKPCGQITLFSSSILTQTTNTFTLTNSYVGANDLVLVNHISGQTPGSYTIAVNPNAGSADITMRNVNSATLAAGAPLLQFVVIKASIA